MRKLNDSHNYFRAKSITVIGPQKMWGIFWWKISFFLLFSLYKLKQCVSKTENNSLTVDIFWLVFVVSFGWYCSFCWYIALLCNRNTIVSKYSIYYIYFIHKVMDIVRVLFQLAIGLRSSKMFVYFITLKKYLQLLPTMLLKKYLLKRFW